MSKRLTTAEFIERARKVHGDKYDYSKVEYVDANTNVCIICLKHGEFWQTPSNHLRGSGCKECGKIIKAQKKTKNLEYFIKKAREIHGDKYDYSKSVYKGMGKLINIVCPIHGEFKQRAYDHIRGIGCKKCGDISTKEKQSLSTSEFIKKARKVHGDKYDYSKVEYINYRSLVTIICPIHGEFKQSPVHHLNGCGCQKCNDSKLEKMTSTILETKEVHYVQKANKKVLDWIGRQHIDFYLPKYNTAIECQGIQHFKGWGSKTESLKKIQKRDKRKKQLCEEHGVKLYYINYNDDVETKLNEILEKVCHI